MSHGNPGTSVGSGENFGVLGSPNTGSRQECWSVPTAPTSNQDRDADGISNADDWCPDSAGPVSRHGCPINEAATGYVPNGLTFGSSSAIPIVGDWDKSGSSDFGTVSGNTWTLRFSDGHTWSTTFGNGIVNGDVPIVGDWDGDSSSDFGVVNGSTWLIRFADGHTWSTTFGNGIVNGDVPIVGDWDHNNQFDFGIVHGNTWTLRFSDGHTWSTTFGPSVQAHL